MLLICYASSAARDLILFFFFFFCAVLVWRNQLLPSIAFAQEYPLFGLHIGLLALCSASGQIFIYLITQTFGAFELSLAMTTRIFCSVLLSCVIYKHTLSLIEWFCTFVVLGTLYFHAFIRKSYRVMTVHAKSDQPQNE